MREERQADRQTDTMNRNIAHPCRGQSNSCTTENQQ